MRFVFLTLGYHPDQIGGGYRYVTCVAERLASRGHEVHAVYPAPHGGPAAVVEQRGVTCHRFPNGSGNFISNWLRENRSARQRIRALAASAVEPGILISAHAFHGLAVSSWTGRSAYLFSGPWAEEYRFSRQSAPRRPLARAWDSLVALVMQRVERRAMRSTGMILTPSHYWVKMLPRWHPCRLPPITVISGGVDTEFFKPAPDRDNYRQGRGVGAGDFLFLTVRRLDARMGLLGLIEAFGGIARSFPQARLWLAGRGPQEAVLRDAILRAKLGDRVRLLGFVPEQELPLLYSAADCTLMPSLDLEGFGLATVESLACGTPVIGSRAGATPEVLGELAPDLLFDPSLPEGLSQCLRSVLGHPALLPRREQCVAFAQQRFSWDRVVDSVESAAALGCGTPSSGVREEPHGF